jgi:hypothetical protein
LHVLHQTGNVVNERTFCTVAGQNIDTVVAAFEGARAIVETEPAFRFGRAVTAETGGFQDGLDVAGEIDLSLGGRWQFG